MGLSPSELIRQGLRLAAAPYYAVGKRVPKTRLFFSINPQLGQEKPRLSDLPNRLKR